MPARSVAILVALLAARVALPRACATANPDPSAPARISSHSELGDAGEETAPLRSRRVPRSAFLVADGLATTIYGQEGSFGVL